MSNQTPVQVLRLPVTEKGRAHLRLCNEVHGGVWAEGTFYREHEGETLFDIDWDELAEIVESAPKELAR